MTPFNPAILPLYPPALSRSCASVSSLSWRPARVPFAPAADRPDLRFCSAALKRADVLDLDTVALPGAFVVLPYGMRLMRRFQSIVEDHYARAGLIEYDYPYLVPDSCLDGTRRLINLEGRLLHAGVHTPESGADRPFAVLAPTGEAVVYTHWRSLVRSRRLPIEMFRRARYFRPLSSGHHAGRGLFRAMESGDVYEFHCCYAGRSQALEALARLHTMLRELTEAVHLPALWSTRPPWTNNHTVAESVVAADVLLPLGKTLQVAAVYDQRDRFSREYGITLPRAAGGGFTEHVTGFSSRRLLLTHLLLGLRADGSLRLHPDLAPVQVAIEAGRDAAPLAAALVEALQARGVRAEAADGERGLRSANHTRGVPVQVLVQAPRHAGDAIRMVLIRGDDGSEATLLVNDVAVTVGPVVDTLVEVGATYRRDTARSVEQNLFAVDHAAELSDARREGVIVCPLAATPDAVHALEARRVGEVLGFARSARPYACVETHTTVDTVAYLARRI